MKKETIMRIISLPTAKGLCGARRVAMMLLMTMLTSIGAWADEINFLYEEGTPYLNMQGSVPCTKTLSDASITSFKVYDNGGRTGNYYDVSRSTLTITAPEGYLLQLSGWIQTYDNWSDHLTVYDNSEASGTKLIDQMSSTSGGFSRNIPTVTSTGRSMTLYFYSNNDGNDKGFDLDVRLIVNEPHDININTATGGTVGASVSGVSVTSARVKETVTLTATPQSTYMLTGISVKDGSNKNVGVTWDGPFYNTATFTMPYSVATVTPTFTNNLTAAGGLYINMPKTDSKSLTIPSNVKSFKVYDDGGSTGNYSNNCDGTLVLTAPTGYRMQLSGGIKLYNGYKGIPTFTVYDGSNNTASELYHKNGYYGSTTVTSTGNTMTINLTSGGTEDDGLDLTVSVFDPNTQNAINGIGNLTGGTITASISNESVTSAKAFEAVTLTATPQSDYMLTSISIKDDSNKNVDLKWDGPFDNTATFTMPISPVTVTSTFTNDLTADGGLYINMPATGSKSLTIPSNVQSFKVYDDGGKDGNHSKNCSGYLTLTAPTGYVLQLSGNITTMVSTYQQLDYLTVYDYNAACVTKLIDKMCSSAERTQTAIPTVFSSSNTMTLYFTTNSTYNNYAGLDLTVTLVREVELADNADNTTVINNNEVTTTVKISGRTLYKDGDWNTLCLPFSMTAEQIALSPLAGATIKELATSSNLNNGTLTLNFEDATTIEAGKPYLVKWMPATPDLTINNKADWDTFAAAVNGGNTYEGKLVKLADDFDNSGDGEAVTTLVGTNKSSTYYPFKGTFDGNGRTLTVNINSTDKNNIGPFRFVNGATIKNLHVAGSITTNKQIASGIAARVIGGTVTIQNCISSVAITDNYAPGEGPYNGLHGGIVGRIQEGTVSISNCLFNGQLLNGSTDVYNTGGDGGFVGLVADAGSLNLTSCLFAPSNITMKSNNSCTFYRKSDNATVNDSKIYYNTPFGTVQGTDASGMNNEILLSNLGAGWEISGGNVVPKMNNNNIVDPRFGGVTIVKTAPAPVNFTGGSFVGTYNPFAITDANRKSIVLLAAGNKLGYAKTHRTLGAFRAYFDIPSVAGAPAISSYELNFGEDDDENTTGIIEVNTNNTNLTNKAEGVFDLQGRRIANGQKPTAKGLYIVNGKKIVIK